MSFARCSKGTSSSIGCFGIGTGGVLRTRLRVLLLPVAVLKNSCSNCTVKLGLTNFGRLRKPFIVALLPMYAMEVALFLMSTGNNEGTCLWSQQIDFDHVCICAPRVIATVSARTVWSSKMKLAAVHLSLCCFVKMLRGVLLPVVHLKSINSSSMETPIPIGSLHAATGV